MILVSWACRPCAAGDWGERVPDRCRFCGGPLTITGNVRAVNLGADDGAEVAA